MDEVTDPSLKILGRSIKSIPLFIKGILIKYLSWLISESIMDGEHFGYNILPGVQPRTADYTYRKTY